MKPTVIRYDANQIEKLRKASLANGIKPTIQNIHLLALHIAIDCVNHLDEESFQQLTGLNK